MIYVFEMMLSYWSWLKKKHFWKKEEDDIKRAERKQQFA